MFPDITCDDIFRIETTQLWLRWLRASDAPALAAIASVADVAQMTASIPHPYPPGEAERFILKAREATAAGNALILAVTTKAKAQTLVGLVSALAADRGEIEIGYIVAPSMAGRGYASAATAGLVDLIFNLTETRTVTADSRVINPASRRVLEKCGFTYTTTALKNLPARGGEHSCDFFRFDRHDWSARGRVRPMPGMTQQRTRDEDRAWDQQALSGQQ